MPAKRVELVDALRGYAAPDASTTARALIASIGIRNARWRIAQNSKESFHPRISAAFGVIT